MASTVLDAGNIATFPYCVCVGGGSMGYVTIKQTHRDYSKMNIKDNKKGVRWG